MPKVRPSEVVAAIDQLFPASERAAHKGTPHWRQTEVRALLTLLDDIPNEFIQLRFSDYLEFVRHRAALASALPAWNLGGSNLLSALVRQVLSKVFYSS